ncbi:hypothetical protein DPMN_069334 [Dreissena polymorpha]|uniref:Uncharacterized protein n=1 Tax=Dreissena polymorpha TaxID=45954 RepID=A0A9D3Z1B5_DREPO|nr:hypothetical protein DPMN_069334 [Dreissena polymorpha]
MVQSAKARNFLKALKDKGLVMWLLFLLDRVNCLSDVSMVIQANNCTVSDRKTNYYQLYDKGRPRIDRIVIRDVQYQFEVNRCRNEEVNFKGSRANSVGGVSGQDGRTDRRRR